MPLPDCCICKYSSETVRAPLRRNILHNNAAISTGGATEDVIVKNSAVRLADAGIRISDTERGVFLRDNTFDAVIQPEN